MANGFLLDRDSVAALARLLRERGTGSQTIERNIVDTWPTCHPARVTVAITAREEDEPGEGKVKLLISDQVTGDAATQNIKLIAGDDTEEQTVYRISKSTDEIAVDEEGYVIQDRTGKLWWVESKETKLVRFTLTAALAASGTAAATIVSSGTDNGTTITVTDWAGNAGTTGDSGIAWKNGETYWVIEIKASKLLVRFTLDEDIGPISHRAGATINSSGADNGETIEVLDWSENGGKSGDKGVAWKTTITEGEETEGVYVIVELKRAQRVQFIQGTTSTAGDFESAAAESFTLQAIVGVDQAWDGDETTTVHNPLEIKVWDSDCLIKCQWNQDEERYEVVAATQKYVMHGVRIFKQSSTCRFEKLDSTGISNWNDETFPDVITTSPNWVTQVYGAGTAPNQTLRYKTYCMDVSNTGVQILEIGNACP